MKQERRHYSVEEKVAFLRRHRLDKVFVSDLCEELGLRPTVFYGWQKEFFENGAAAFQSQERPHRQGEEKQKRMRSWRRRCRPRRLWTRSTSSTPTTVAYQNCPTFQLSGNIADWPLRCVPPSPGISADGVEIGNRFRGNLKHRRLKILAKMLDRRCSGDHQHVGRPLEKPSKSNLHGRGTEARGDIRQGSGLQWGEPAEWKEWHIGDTVTSKIGDESIVGSMREVVVVLHADDGSDPSCFRDLRGRDVAQPDMTHQTLLLEFG